MHLEDSSDHMMQKLQIDEETRFSGSHMIMVPFLCMHGVYPPRENILKRIYHIYIYIYIYIYSD